MNVSVIFWLSIIIILIASSGLIGIGVLWNEMFTLIIKNNYFFSISIGFCLNGSYIIIIIICTIYSTLKPRKAFIYFSMFLHIFIVGCSIGHLIHLTLGYHTGENIIVEILDLYSNNLHKNINYLDKIQEKFNCCGLESHQFWLDHYPDSCCFDRKISDCTTIKDNIIVIGCKESIILKYKIMVLV
ncbi:hypothetical protein HZS_872, partial [Henneguya salminicola]